MLLTLRVAGPHAADLGVLLGQFPDKLHSESLPFGAAHVFFSDSRNDEATVALLVDVDAVDWSSNEIATKFVMANSARMSVALASVFRSALLAHCPDKPHLVTTALPLEARFSSVFLALGAESVKAVFGPLGYEVETTEIASDADACSYAVRLVRTCPLYEMLSHMYALFPVLDGTVSDRVLDDHVSEILQQVEGFVRGHPDAERITGAYLGRKPSRVHAALTRLVAIDSNGDVDAADNAAASLLDDARMDAIASALRSVAAQSVLDLGCGDGKLIARLVREKALTRIVGLDVSHRLLDAAASRMKLDRRAGKKSERIDLFHGSLFYKDSRLTGFDAAVLADVIQHISKGRLSTVEQVVFEYAHCKTIVVLMSTAQSSWPIDEFDRWASGVSSRHVYRANLSTVGATESARMAVFAR